MAFCIECGAPLLDGMGDCPECRSAAALITPETMFTEARLTAAVDIPTTASAAPPRIGRWAVAALALGVCVAILLTLAGGLLRI